MIRFAIFYSIEVVQCSSDCDASTTISRFNATSVDHHAASSSTGQKYSEDLSTSA
jgi:hypothetical protein